MYFTMPWRTVRHTIFDKSYPFHKKNECGNYSPRIYHNVDPEKLQALPCEFPTENVRSEQQLCSRVSIQGQIGAFLKFYDPTLCQKDLAKVQPHARRFGSKPKSPEAGRLLTEKRSLCFFAINEPAWKFQEFAPRHGKHIYTICQLMFAK